MIAASAVLVGVPQRDRFVDAVRAASIVAVIVGHWLIDDLDWDGHLVRGPSALGAWPSLWPLTWVLQVMGVFFFVGGFANSRSWESGRKRGEGYATFVVRRLHRLVVPAALCLAALTVTGAVIGLTGHRPADLGSMLTQPLWFLATYVVVMALTPVTVALHRRRGWRCLIVIATSIVAVDVVRIALGVEAFGYVNVALVWGGAHQLGYLWSQGRLSRRAAAWLAGGGLMATACLTGFGPYPARMVGVHGDTLVNSHPPTCALAALAVAQIGAVVLMERWGRVVLQRDRLWRAVVAVNLVVMTLYVWHQPAITMAANIAFAFGLAHPAVGSGAWLGARLALVVPAAATLVALVMVFGRAESGLHRPDPVASRPVTTVGAVTAVVLVGIGLIGAATTRVLDPFRTVTVTAGIALPAVAPLSCLAAGALLLLVIRRWRPTRSPATPEGAR